MTVRSVLCEVAVRLTDVVVRYRLHDVIVASEARHERYTVGQIK